MQVSLRLKLDEAENRLTVELEPGGKVAKRIPLAPVSVGLEPVTLDVDAEGYVVSVSVPGLKEALAEIRET